MGRMQPSESSKQQAARSTQHGASRTQKGDRDGTSDHDPSYPSLRNCTVGTLSREQEEEHGVMSAIMINDHGHGHGHDLRSSRCVRAQHGTWSMEQHGSSRGGAHDRQVRRPPRSLGTEYSYLHTRRQGMRGGGCWIPSAGGLGNTTRCWRRCSLACVRACVRAGVGVCAGVLCLCACAFSLFAFR